MKNHKSWSGIGVMFILVLCCAIATITIFTTRYVESVAIKATATAEALLTETHYAEVADVIENFEMQWFSLEAYKDPSIRCGLATKPFLDDGDRCAERDRVRGEFYPRYTAVRVTHLRVLEYTPQRFKAVAAVETTEEWISYIPEGEVIKSDVRSPNPICGISVFVRVDDVWKLSGYLYLEKSPEYELREWYDKQVLGELREVIGEFPSGDLCGW